MAQTDAERRAKQAEERATLFANDPAQLRENLTTTSTRKVGKDQVKRTSTHFDKRKFNQAREDFNNRGEGDGTAEAQSRGAGGGSFATEGDFGPGAIRLNTITAVNSKVHGR